VSRKSVRVAVADWFGNNNVAGLNRVTRSEPVNFWGSDFIAEGDDSGGVAYVHVDGEHERRITGPAQQPGISPPSGAGWKEITYQVGLVISFRSVAQDPGGEDDPGELAMDGFDDAIEGIKTRLRSDTTLGDAVFSAGEGGAHQQDDIVVRSDMPVRVKGTVHIKSVVEFTVTEWLRA
jgi:hypothetical protein